MMYKAFMEEKMNYIGEKCICCNKEFQQGDDVVVCPECGTPYHRDCYKQNGACINNELHEKGESWQRSIQIETEKTPADLIRESENKIICKNCLAKNDKNSTNCINCGKELKKSNSVNSDADLKEFFSEFDSTQKYFGFNPDEEFDGTRLEEVAEFVNTNTLYYLPLFKKMKEVGSKISLNITCFFFPQFYFANRKMWFMAILTMIISIILKVPGSIIAIIENFDTASAEGLFNSSLFSGAEIQEIYQRMINFFEPYQQTIENADYICTALGYLFKLLMCFFGNWLYYKFTIKSIKRIKNQHGKMPINLALNSAGGTSTANIIITAILSLCVYFGFSWLLIICFG